MAYTLYDSTKPAGSQTGSAFATSANANSNALLDMIGMLQMQGFAFSQSGGTAEEPTTLLFKNGTRWLRAVLTWSSGNVTGITYSLSTNSGSTYDTIGSASVLTYDGSGNLTATTNFGGMISKLWEWIGKVKALRTTLTGHTGATGTAVHGLGTMSTQSASAVNISGGTVSCTIEREVKVALGSINASTPVNWALGGLFTVTATGSSAVLTHTGLPSGVVGYVTLDITNGGLATSLLSGCKIAGGVLPTLTSAGRDLVSLMCHDGSTVTIVGYDLNVS